MDGWTKKVENYARLAGSRGFVGDGEPQDRTVGEVVDGERSRIAFCPGKGGISLGILVGNGLCC